MINNKVQPDLRSVAQYVAQAAGPMTELVHQCRNKRSLHAAEIAEECTALAKYLEAPQPERKPRGQNVKRVAYAFGDWLNPWNNCSWHVEDVDHSVDLFKKEMRVSKQLFDSIVHQSCLKLKQSGKKISDALVERKIAVVIRYLATTEPIGSVGTHFRIAKPTVSCDLRDGVDIILQTFQSGDRKTIKFPTGQRLQQVERWFHEKSFIHNVVGAIDGSYIYVKKPTGRRYAQIADKFYGRKGCGILLQAVAGPDRCFYDVDIRQPASNGDWNTYKKSRLFRKLRSADPPVPAGSQLLADAGYYADPHLLVPFSRKAQYSQQELNFNYCHSKARVVIEDAFGILKMRWRRLHNFHIVEDIDFVPRLVKTACVLHNLCRQHSDFVNVGIVFGYDMPQQYTTEEVLQWTVRPDADLDPAQANVLQLPIVFNLEANERDAGEADLDREPILREHDNRRAAAMRVLPNLLTNRAVVYNRLEYFGDRLLG